ncbi:hypothetical protein HPB49_002685 [Dermacentor silvarum]|uniref:Uncharacterized protein n=1 Tax=Dermacentor silvarum TaxID=543639 RepID=A0ACB8CNZ9_DERSI|nr:hypothetical protein HPB49_002685 [Dermacentor silvarum]
MFSTGISPPPTFIDTPDIFTGIQSDQTIRNPPPSSFVALSWDRRTANFRRASAEYAANQGRATSTVAAATPTSHSADVRETAETAGTQTRPHDGTAEAPRLPDEYDVSLETLTRHFAAPCKIRLQRHGFRERRELQGKPITDFATALRELAVLRDFATQADDNMCEQFVAGVMADEWIAPITAYAPRVTADSAHARTPHPRLIGIPPPPLPRRPELQLSAQTTAQQVACHQRVPLAVTHALPADATVTFGELVEAPAAHENGTLPRSTKSHRKKMLQKMHPGLLTRLLMRPRICPLEQGHPKERSDPNSRKPLPIVYHAVAIVVF